jgi:PIN domain nuclease of toxin-antitoxin system
MKMRRDPAALLLDTHVWIWLVRGERRFAKTTLDALFDAAGVGALFVSVMSIWEIALLDAKRRLRLDQPCREWVRRALARSRTEVIVLTTEIAIESHNLPSPLHSDPADRIIAATARVEDLTLVTRDRPLLDYARQGHLRALPC